MVSAPGLHALQLTLGVSLGLATRVAKAPKQLPMARNTPMSTIGEPSQNCRSSSRVPSVRKTMSKTTKVITI